MTAAIDVNLLGGAGKVVVDVEFDFCAAWGVVGLECGLGVGEGRRK